jgi:hypothetical protein
MALVYSLRAIHVPVQVIGVLVVTYVLFALYTWVATPLVNFWIRLRPPR